MNPPKRHYFHLPLKLKSFFTLQRISFFLVFIGVILRLNHYLANRSFWLDEAWVALDISVRSLWQIFYSIPHFVDLPLNPLGFSLIEKLSILFLGNSDCVLRLFPFVSGIISIIFFYAFLKRYSHPNAIPIAMGLFVFSKHLIYYSAELKQYSSDVMVALGLYLIFYFIRRRELTMLRFILFGLAGFLAIFLSYTAVFILASIGTTSLYHYSRLEDKEPMRRLVLIYCFWIVSFGIFYFITFINIPGRHILIETAKRNDFMTASPIASLQTIKWLLSSFITVFNNPVGIFPPILGFILFCFGLKAMWKNNKERVLIFILPIFLTLITGILKIYPFGGRFLLFLVPIILVFIADGVYLILSKLKRYSLIIGLVVICVLFYGTVKESSAYFKYLPREKGIRDVVKFLKENKREKDTLCLNNFAQYGFSYYAGYFKIKEPFNPVGRFSDEVYFYESKPYLFLGYVDLIYDKEGFYKEVKNVRMEKGIYLEGAHKFSNNSRMWILFSHIKDDQRQAYLKYFDRIGDKKKTFETKGASIYLYDFSLGLPN